LDNKSKRRKNIFNKLEETTKKTALGGNEVLSNFGAIKEGLK